MNESLAFVRLYSFLLHERMVTSVSPGGDASPEDSAEKTTT